MLDLKNGTNHFLHCVTWPYSPEPKNRLQLKQSVYSIITITGAAASSTVLVLLNWYALLLMDNLAEHENAAASLQIRSD